ncbi:hypothetical protein [Clostridium estertheticum]|nr:hypothetical protein [Clostridium estertheticum]MBX4258834.1 hypothetical protein [Clostridium estertheticum]
MNQCTQTQQLSKMSSKITKELEARLGCSVITTDFPKRNIMRFYVFIDAKGLPSNTNYRIAICEVIENINDLNIYVNYVLKCLASKIFVQGTINSMSKIIYNLDGLDDSEVYCERIDNTFHHDDDKDLFYINEDISIKSSLGNGTLVIMDRGYGNTLVDFNTNIYSIAEFKVA